MLEFKNVIAGHSASKTRVNALMTRQSILLRKIVLQRRWMPGSSPGMTDQRFMPISVRPQEAFHARSVEPRQARDALPQGIRALQRAPGRDHRAAERPRGAARLRRR